MYSQATILSAFKKNSIPKWTSTEATLDFRHHSPGAIAFAALTNMDSRAMGGF